jgi:hypothetical protein
MLLHKSWIKQDAFDMSSKVAATHEWVRRAWIRFRKLLNRSTPLSPLLRVSTRASARVSM